jgi:hypothetical protein
MGRLKGEATARSETRARRRSPPARLRDLFARGLEVFCWCNRCGHNARLPTARLIAQLGPDMPVPEVGARLRCSGCQSKDVATRPDWPAVGQVTSHTGLPHPADGCTDEGAVEL